MKKLFSLLLVLFLSQLAFSQIRLDSILVTSSIQELEEAYRFGYDGDLITSYSEDFLSIDIVNNSNGDFEKFVFTSDYYEQNEFDFKYNSAQQLDSIIFTIEDYGYVLNQYYDFIYQDDILVQLNISFVEDGYEYEGEYREYFYENDLVDSITVSDLYDGSISSYSYDYNIDDKLVEIRYRDEVGMLWKKWEMEYEGSQMLELRGFNYIINPAGELLFGYQYEHESEIPFSQIQTPQNVFEVIDIIAINEFPEFLIPFQNTTQVARIAKQSVGDFPREYLYFYSGVVGTEEERIVMTPISVSPNPTSAYINISVEKEIHSISILSIDGQLISQQASASKQVDVQSLANGQYTIIVELEDGSHVFGQFIKQ